MFSKVIKQIMVIEKYKNDRSALVLEIILLLGLLFLALKQYLIYDVVSDPDPDGYVSYANYLLQNWSLPEEHRRLPGYPLFLALVDAVGPYGMLLDAYWAQFFLTALLVSTMWWYVRRSYGVFEGIIFVAIFAVPKNFFIYFSTVAMSDLLRQIFLTIYFFLIVRYLEARISVLSYGYIALFVATGAVTYLIHPGSQGIIYLFLFFLAASACIYGYLKNTNAEYVFNKVFISKLVVVALALTTVVPICKQLADRGNTAFYENWSGWRIAMCLPPAGHTKLTEKIASAKGAISHRLGYPIEYARPNVFPELGNTPIHEAPPFGATREEWRQEKWKRLTAYPGKYLGCMLREVLYRQYDIISHYYPFTPDNTFYKPAYRPLDTSPASLVFRATGIDLVEFDAAAKWPELWGQLTIAFVKIAIFYGLLAVGLHEAAKRTPVLATAIPLTVIAWGFAIVTLVSLEPRYFLPFAPFVYLVQALAIVVILRRFTEFLWRSLRCGYHGAQ